MENRGQLLYHRTFTLEKVLSIVLVIVILFFIPWVFGFIYYGLSSGDLKFAIAGIIVFIGLIFMLIRIIISYNLCYFEVYENGVYQPKLYKKQPFCSFNEITNIYTHKHLIIFKFDSQKRMVSKVIFGEDSDKILNIIQDAYKEYNRKKKELHPNSNYDGISTKYRDESGNKKHEEASIE